MTTELQQIATASQQMAFKLRKPILPQEFAAWGAFVQDFEDFTSVPFTTTPGAIAWVTAREFVVPAQKRAVCHQFAVDSNNEVADLFIRWRILLNGNPIQNYQAPPFNLGGVSNPSQIWVQVEQENRITLQLGNIDDTQTYFMFTRLVLWTWDLRLHPTRGE